MAHFGDIYINNPNELERCKCVICSNEFGTYNTRSFPPDAKFMCTPCSVLVQVFNTGSYVERSDILPDTYVGE